MKKLFFGLGAFAVILVLYYLGKKKQIVLPTTSSATTGTTTTNTGGNTSTTNAPTSNAPAGFKQGLNYDLVLTQNLSTPEVIELQKMLNFYANRVIAPTGTMDFLTRDALYWNSTPKSRETTLRHFIQTHSTIRYNASNNTYDII